MPPSKHHYHVAAAIPPHLSPDDVIAALHDHNTTLTLQALTTGHKKLPDVPAHTRKDTFWYPVDLHPISAYAVTEIIVWMPMFQWGKYNLTFPSCFQNTPTGLRSIADTNGVVLRAEFRVVHGDSVDAEVSGEGAGLGDVGFVLVEDVEVSCAWYMMPFVKGKMEEAHRDICKKIVEKVVMEKQQEAVAQGVLRGRDSMGSPTGSPVEGRTRPHAESKPHADPLPEKVRYA